jgi:ferredoxin
MFLCQIICDVFFADSNTGSTSSRADSSDEEVDVTSEGDAEATDNSDYGSAGNHSQ